MSELYSISQLIKSHPQYSLKRHEIHTLYSSMGSEGILTLENLEDQLQVVFPEIYFSLQKNTDLLKRHSEEVLTLQMRGVNFLCYGEPLYPSLCYCMADPPLTLSYLGSPAWLNQRTLSVVGSREPSSESIHWMEQEFAVFCEKENPCVISGGARGIDQKAHSVALRKDCTTTVVLPSGLGNMYPHSLRDWTEAILDRGGCLLSEYAFEQKMHKYLFHHRNRLIAALGKASLLVEARRRSGTLITAQQATQLGRPVWVVPGHPQDPHFTGSLELLMEGALMIRDAQDLSFHFQSELSHKNFL